jgi:hypothetical protein
VLAWVPPEKRLRGLTPEQQEEVLAAIPTEKRLHGLTPEEVLRSLTPERFAANLSEEQAARLRELLERRQSR